MTIPPSDKPVRARIRRAYVEDGLYFITTVAHQRRPLFTPPDIERLRTTLRQVKTNHPFTMHAYVFLPDHLHLLLRVGAKTDISKIMHSLKRNATVAYKAAHGIEGIFSLWQRGFWDHVIRNERDFKNHLDYIHYNPVKHGIVAHPEEYPHSSYREYVRRGWYEIGWGHNVPDGIATFETPEP